MSETSATQPPGFTEMSKAEQIRYLQALCGIRSPSDRVSSRFRKVISIWLKSAKSGIARIRLRQSRLLMSWTDSPDCEGERV